jgi:hypothetical protein
MNEPALTPELLRSIVAAIRAGGFPHVASAANQVHAALFERWLRLGRRKHAAEPYRGFVCEVDAAQAQARLRAEVAVQEKDPRTWLKHGPGRDLPGKPGWSALARPSPPPGERGADLASAPEFLQLLTKLRAALAPFPEALAAAAQVLDASGD